MKLTIESSLLARASHLVAGIADAQGPLPSLAALRIKVGEQVALSATNLETSLRVTIPAPETAIAGEAAVPAKAFDTLVRALPSGPVTLTLSGGRLALQAGKTKATWGTYALEDLPDPMGSAVEAQYRGTVAIPVLLGVLARTIHAVGKDHHHPYLTGLYLEGAGRRLKVTACDNSRLAHVPMAMTEGEGSAARVAPGDGCRVIQRVLAGVPGDVTLRVADDAFDLDAGNIQMRLRCFAARGYPDYQAVLAPKGDLVTVTTARAPLATALARIRPVAQEVTITAEPKLLRLQAVSEGRDIEEELDGTASQPGEIKLGCGYLADVLDVIRDDDVVIQWGTDPKSPCWFSDASFPETAHMMAPRI